jgi:pyruvate dehydrogenase E1 component alpha subunit
MKAYIIEKGLADNDALDLIDTSIKEEIVASVEFAENSTEPALEAVYENVYEEDDYPFLV